MNNYYDMTTKDVADFLGVSNSHVYNLANGTVKGSPAIPHKRNGDRYSFNREEIELYGRENNFLDGSDEPKVHKSEPPTITKLSIRTRLANLQPPPSKNKDEVARVALNSLKIYHHDKTGEFDVHQSRNGDECFMSQAVINKAISFLNKGYQIIHQFFDENGELIHEEDFSRTVERLNDLDIIPRRGKLGRYYVITLNGFILR